nr:hypothetical protein [uncultured Desulfobulbus sp.]
MNTQPLTLTPAQFQLVDLTDLYFPDPLLSTLYPEPDRALCSQIQRHGLFEPFPVHKVAADCYHLLAGFQYLPVLHQLGGSKVTCQVVTEPASFASFALQIQHGLSTVPSSPILQAALLRSASSTLAEQEVLELLPFLGIKPQRYKLEELLSMLELEPVVIQALHTGVLSAKNGKHFSRIGPEDQRYLVSLLEIFRPGGSKQLRLIEMLLELTLRHAQPMEALIQPWMDTRFGEQQNNLPQQLQALLRYLQEQINPHLIAAEKQFILGLQEIELPANVQLQHALSFEDKSVELRITYADLNSFKEHWPKLNALIDPS